MNCKYLKTMTKKCSKKNKKISYKDCVDCKYKEYKTDHIPIKQYSMKNKSAKIKNLEKNRKSVFFEKLDYCFLCGKKKQELHEIFAGRNRLNSMKYNFVLPMCSECHRLNQNNPFFNDFWHKKAQLYFETHIGSKTEFISIFKKDYLTK